MTKHHAHTNGDDHSLERAALRLDGLEIYAVVGALQAGTSVAMIQDLGEFEPTPAAESASLMTVSATELIHFAFLIFGVAATLGGIYATVIFALCSLYGKTALGMNRDRMYDCFMQATGQQRFRAFQAFTTSLLLFCVQARTLLPVVVVCSLTPLTLSSIVGGLPATAAAASAASPDAASETATATTTTISSFNFLGLTHSLTHSLAHSRARSLLLLECAFATLADWICAGRHAIWLEDPSAVSSSGDDRCDHHDFSWAS